MKHVHIGREYRPPHSMFERRTADGGFSQWYPDLGREGERLQSALLGGGPTGMGKDALDAAILAGVIAAVVCVVLWVVK